MLGLSLSIVNDINFKFLNAALSAVLKAFKARVEADGGVLEALGCLKTAFPYIPTSSAITAILTPLKARSTYYENEVGTIKTLQSLENCEI